VTTPASTRTMSAADAAFLNVERKEIPLHIASVCIFDGPISFSQFVANVNSKLHLVPRYRQIPCFSSWGLDFPTWQDDPNFDIHRHIIHVTLKPPGGPTELQAFASKIFSQLLDRNKALWDVHVIDGLKDGHGALIFRVHHALADGVSGIELMKLLLEPTADVPSSYPKPRYRRARRKISQHSLGESISGAINGTLGSLLEFEAGMLRFAQTLFAQNQQIPVKDLLGLLPEFTASIERLPFNKPCTGARQFCWTEFDLADVQVIRDQAGGTVNDVILAVLTLALARYVKLHGQSVVGRFVRIICPVNLRLSEQTNGLGNQISFLPVALPMDVRGPVRMIKAVTTRTATLKRCGALGFVGVAAKWLAAAPPPLQTLFWRSIPEIILPVPVLNMICTNVVGSPTPLYAVGRKMLAAYPQVPTGYDLGVGCAVHSYNGKLFFGLIADTHAAPDAERLRDFLVLGFEELLQSVARKNVGKAKSKNTRKKPHQQPAEPVQASAANSASAETARPSPPAPEVKHTEAA
jgi:diacylglycerol O-acyltransferase / wax synthase